ncbi:hypothetical protein NIES267_23820 [Calothrix parasitica NIES-267]|uniref:Uncharacterized protein n=1 Tax=Calothrix parasitica NIES-267 TaxID=1973488 RepID=A0A1Z4LNV2_9CYAN|nr:hypothetical protein NIES267_23820 [Calothrix parasitica NIES-267]
MLKASEIAKTRSAEHLLNLWARRYTPEISSLVANSSSCDELLKASTPEGRALTARKLKDKMLDINCQMGWIQTKNLYSYIPNVLDLNEARRITKFAFRVYKKLLDIYQHQSPKIEIENNSLSQWVIPAVEELAYALEPILIIFQEQHVASKDWRSLGFMTSQLNFTNKLMLKKLTISEQALLSPYLKFVEEQVAMPWARVCAKAASYQLNSVELKLVEQMMPIAPEIAKSVYRKLIELLPNNRSRRGKIADKGISHSCHRDLNMFQAYILLCFLEKSLEPIEQELVPLCAMVVKGVEIKWELTQKWCEVLASEMESRLDSQQKSLLQPYTQGMKQAFFKERISLGCEEESQIKVV